MTPKEVFPGIRVAALRDPRGLLLWDGQCSFCARAVQWFERRATRPVSVRRIQEVADVLPEEVRVTASEQMLWVSPAGEVCGGSRAAIEALRASGHPLEARILATLQPLTRWVYRLAARNRGRLGTNACARR